MMNYIILGKHGRLSMMGVSQSMRAPHILLKRKKFRTGNFRWFRFNKQNGRWLKHLRLNVNPTFDRQDTIIRWGYSGAINGNPKIYQDARAINIFSNKARTRLLLAENSIPVPETRLNSPMDSYPFIVRPIRHSRGRNFHVVNNISEYTNIFGSLLMNSDTYSSSIYPKQEEIRVFVGHGKVLMIKDKNYNPEHGIAGNRSITNNEWRVVPVREYRRYKTACNISCDAVRVAGGDMGAVDVMINRESPTMKFCVCEINTAPDIATSEYSIEKHTRYFDWLFSSERNWWNYIHPETGENRQHPTRGSSYFFSNEQLEV